MMLKVTLQLTAENSDGSLFSRATSESFRLSPERFHEFERRVATMLLELGDEDLKLRAEERGTATDG
jgi:hypothetical protein